MVNAGTRNAYYVWDKRMKQFLVVNFTDNDRLLEIIADEAFTTVKQVTDFVADKRKLKAQKVFIAIEGVTQQQAAKMPAITKIKPADIEALKKAVGAQKREIDGLFPGVNIMKEYPAVFMNSAQWLNMQCLIRRYKPPQNPGEYEFLTTLINHCSKYTLVWDTDFLNQKSGGQWPPLFFASIDKTSKLKFIGQNIVMKTL